jgi:hypothetical protein
MRKAMLNQRIRRIQKRARPPTRHLPVTYLAADGTALSAVSLLGYTSKEYIGIGKDEDGTEK